MRSVIAQVSYFLAACILAAGLLAACRSAATETADTVETKAEDEPGMTDTSDRRPLQQTLRELADRTTIVVGHRGDSGAYPENTLPAFAAAVAERAHMVELDFRQTSDGVLVCLHDATLDRTTDAVNQWQQTKLRLARFDLAKLESLDAGSWKNPKFAGTRIPTLEAALGTIQAGSITMIEHKSGDARELVRLLRALRLEDQVLVQSFQWSFLEEVHALAPRIMLAALGGTKKQPQLTDELLLEVRKTHCSMVHWSLGRLQADDVRRLHGLGYLVCVYTVDKIADYDRAIAMGVDAITTNRPRRLREHLQRRAASGR